MGGVEREVWEERGAKRGVKRSVEREGVRWWGREGGRGVRIFNCLSLLRVSSFEVDECVVEEKVSIITLCLCGG